MDPLGQSTSIDDRRLLSSIAPLWLNPLGSDARWHHLMQTL